MSKTLIVLLIIGAIVWVAIGIKLLQAYHNGWKKVDVQRRFNQDRDEEE